MESTTTRLNPLLTVAAVSVIALSAVGVATLTGLIPPSRGQTSDLQLPKEIVQPIAPAISHPVAKPAPRKPAARKTSTIPASQIGVVESIREVKEPGDAKGVGAAAGGVAGGVLGHKLGKGKSLLTILGAAGGAFAGHQIEKQVRAEKQWEVTVRLDDGSQRTFKNEAQPNWHAGDRVRVVNDQLQAA